MQAQSRWFLLFLVVIGLLVVAIWPRSTSTETHSSTRPQVPPAAQADEDRVDSGFFLEVRGSSGFPVLWPRQYRPLEENSWESKRRVLARILWSTSVQRCPGSRP